MLEAVAAHGARIGDLGLGGRFGFLVALRLVRRLRVARCVVCLLLVLVVLVVLVVVLVVLVRLELLGPQLVAGLLGAVQVVFVVLFGLCLGIVGVGLALLARRQRGQHPGQRVDLVGAQREAVGERRLVGREHALEAEHEREAEAPARARGVQARRDLLERGIERTTARRARGEGHRRVVPLVQQRLAAPGRDLCGSVHEIEFFYWLRRGGNRQFAQQRAPSKASAG